MENIQIKKAETIAYNFNLDQLSEAFKSNIAQFKPQNKAEWERLIDDTIKGVHEDAWTVFRYDEQFDELVFVNLEDGKVKYECTMDNENLPKLFDRKMKWHEIHKRYMVNAARRMGARA